MESMTMPIKDRKVKGSLLIDYARLIKRNKDRHWEKYLTKEDMEIINRRVLASIWYPYETFRRCGLATFHEIAGGNLDLVRAFGRASAEYLAKDIYKTTLGGRDPVKAILNFSNLRRQFFNYDSTRFEKIGDKHLKHIINPTPDLEGVEVYTVQIIGTMERLIEINGGKNPKVVLLKKQWAGDAITEIDLAWE